MGFVFAMKFLNWASVVLIFSAAISQAQDVVPAERTVDRLVQQAKQSGESSVRFPTQSREYPIVKSLNQALKMTVPIRVQVEGKETFVSTDGNPVDNTLYGSNNREYCQRCSVEIPLPS